MLTLKNLIKKIENKIDFPDGKIFYILLQGIQINILNYLM